jgi:hypothetical protein
MLRLLLMTDAGPQYPEEVCLGVIQITNAPGGTTFMGNYEAGLFAPTGELMQPLVQLTGIPRGQEPLQAALLRARAALLALEEARHAQ